MGHGNRVISACFQFKNNYFTKAHKETLNECKSETKVSQVAIDLLEVKKGQTVFSNRKVAMTAMGLDSKKLPFLNQYKSAQS